MNPTCIHRKIIVPEKDNYKIVAYLERGISFLEKCKQHRVPEVLWNIQLRLVWGRRNSCQATSVMTFQINYCSIIDIQTSSKLIKINYILKCISLQAKNLNYMVLYMDNEILAWIMDIKINIENYSYILLINFWYIHPQKHWINTPIKICFIYILVKIIDIHTHW